MVATARQPSGMARHDHVRTIERSMDYDDPLMAEIYDHEETETDDVDLIRGLIGALPTHAQPTTPRLTTHNRPLSILECFSGTGRVLVPLLRDGHRVTGIEIAQAMQDRAAAKVTKLPEEARNRATLITGDALEVDWGSGYDVAILGGNCLFELPSPQTQEECIRQAAHALVPGGHLYVDNNEAGGHGADPSDVGHEWIGLEGTGADGTHGKLVARVTDVEPGTGIAHFVRTWHKRHPDGREETTQYRARKYPVSGQEVEAWLVQHGFEVVAKYGDRQGTIYGDEACDRAIFWAIKR
jgi:SAM-dependent methyltransferase